MNNNEDSSKLEILDKLIEGYSTQTTVANKFGLANLIAIITCLATTITCCSLIKLPFDLGEVSNNTYFSIQVVIISILSIGYTSAMIHSMRTRKLIQRIIDNSSDKFLLKIKGENFIHIQDYVDSTINPTFNRVAPLGKFLMGLKHFKDDPIKSLFRRIFAVVIYAIMKLFTYFIMYYAPIHAIGYSLNNSFDPCIGNGKSILPYIILLIISIVALFSILSVFILDVIVSFENGADMIKDNDSKKNETTPPTEQ